MAMAIDSQSSALVLAANAAAEEAFFDCCRLLPSDLKIIVLGYILNEWVIQSLPRPRSLSLCRGFLSSKRTRTELSSMSSQELRKEATGAMTDIRQEARFLEMDATATDALEIAREIEQEKQRIAAFFPCVSTQVLRTKGALSILDSAGLGQKPLRSYTTISAASRSLTTLPRVISLMPHLEVINVDGCPNVKVPAGLSHLVNKRKRADPTEQTPQTPPAPSLAQAPSAASAQSSGK